MFWIVPLSIIRRFSLYTQQWHMSCRFADSLQAVTKPVWHIPLLCVQWKTPDDGRTNCLKHIEFHSKNEFEKLVHLVGFIIGIFCVSLVPVTVFFSWCLNFIHCGFTVHGVYWNMTLRKGFLVQLLITFCASLYVVCETFQRSWVTSVLPRTSVN